MMKRFRFWLWFKLICLADRIAPERAFHRCTSLTLTLEPWEEQVRYLTVRGAVWKVRTDGVGLPIWYSGDDRWDSIHDASEMETV